MANHKKFTFIKFIYQRQFSLDEIFAFPHRFAFPKFNSKVDCKKKSCYHRPPNETMALLTRDVRTLLTTTFSTLT